MFFLVPGLCEFFGGWWMVRDFFLRGYRRSRVKLLGANIRSLSKIMAQVNHGVPDNDSRSLYKIGIVLFKTKKQWWVFSRVLSQHVKSVLLRKNLRYVGYYMVFFSCPPFNGSINVQRAYQVPIFDPLSVEKRERIFLPSFPTLNAGALCDFLHLLGLTLQGVVSGFVSLRFFLGSATRSHLSSLTKVFHCWCLFLGRQEVILRHSRICCLLWMICWGSTPWFVGFHGCFFGSATCRMQNRNIGWKITHLSSFCVTFFSHKNSWSKNSLEAPIFWWVPGDPPQKNGRKKPSPFWPKSETKQKDPWKKYLKIECSKKMKKKTKQVSLTHRFFFREYQ